MERARRRDLVFLLLAAAAVSAAAEQPFFDRTHLSRVFGHERNYRIFLPADYETSAKRYPVIYYFHGHSDRYTLERYDDGQDTVPKIAAFVAGHDVIVVSVDGYVARDYTGFYGGSPWDVREEGGQDDFGRYFLELVDHIDSSYRTLTDRRRRGTSGLSMGGFMSLYLSARYPDRIGSASSFNPGPEFFTGDPGRRMLWRPKDHVSSHNHSVVRLIRASGDYISQYHEETRDAYARSPHVDFEFRQDEYHRHWATSIGETFAFHMRAFERSDLDNVPETFDYASAYRNFEAWGYEAEVAGDGKGFVYLEDVRQGGFRAQTRQWAPDGPAAAELTIHLTTAPVYEPGKPYSVSQTTLGGKETTRSETRADATGRLRIDIPGAGRQVGVNGPGTGAQPPVLLPATSGDLLRLHPNLPVALPVRVLNPRAEPMEDVRVSISSRYPTVEILDGEAADLKIAPGQAADLSRRLTARLTAGEGYFERVRFDVTMTYDGWQSEKTYFDALVIPENTPEPDAIEILDGRTHTFSVFRQKGNQGGGSSVERTVTEGRGDGDGVLEPGEEATVWVRVRQGLDPFDKNNWRRAKIYSDSPWIREIEDIRELKQREWTGAQNRTSLIRLSAETPTGAMIPLLLDTESWSFHYTPEVRYGSEELYQAFQRHKHELHQVTLTSPSPGAR